MLPSGLQSLTREYQCLRAALHTKQWDFDVHKQLTWEPQSNCTQQLAARMSHADPCIESADFALGHLHSCLWPPLILRDAAMWNTLAGKFLLLPTQQTSAASPISTFGMAARASALAERKQTTWALPCLLRESFSCSLYSPLTLIFTQSCPDLIYLFGGEFISNEP